MPILPLILAQIAIFAVAGILMFRWRRRKYAEAARGVADEDSDGWSAVPLAAASTGVRGMRWWFGVAANNANPLLALGADALRYRVVGLTERRYAQLAEVDIHQSFGAHHLRFAFADTSRTFLANVGTADLARQALALLPAGAPLTPRAKALLAAHSDA